MNHANMLTLSRLFFALVLFCMLALADSSAFEMKMQHEARSLLLYIALALFCIAILTDVLDGQIARRWNMVSDFGRLADPFVDKTVILGTFIFLIPLVQIVRPWMVVVILAREFLVSAIRSFSESRGQAFPAIGWGKAKMIIQSWTVGFGLYYAAQDASVIIHGGWLDILLMTSLGLTIVLTVGSGIVYVVHARKLLVAAIRDGA